MAIIDQRGDKGNVTRNVLGAQALEPVIINREGRVLGEPFGIGRCGQRGCVADRKAPQVSII